MIIDHSDIFAPGVLFEMAEESMRIYSASDRVSMTEEMVRGCAQLRLEAYLIRQAREETHGEKI